MDEGRGSVAAQRPSGGSAGIGISPGGPINLRGEGGKHSDARVGQSNDIHLA